MINKFFSREYLKKWIATYLWSIKYLDNDKLVAKFKKELKDLEKEDEIVLELEEEIKKEGEI